MIYPTIHLNGTAKEDLIDSWNTAHWALTHALLKLQDAAPNARDYYPQGPNIFRAADMEHAARLDKLRSVIADLNELREHVMFP